jgi:hypothetical protein
MGSVRFGVPEELVLRLQRHGSIDLFIETGTCYGGSAEWASRYFKRIHTIESSESMYACATSAHRDRTNIEFIFGDSRVKLAELIPKVTSSSIFWLDSHYCCGETFGEADQCPLLQELELIRNSPFEHHILIDDACLFLSAPPSYHISAHWPRIDEIVARLKCFPYEMKIAVIEDVIIGVPASAASVLDQYCYEVNTRAFEARVFRDQHEFAYGLSLIMDGFTAIGQLARAKLGLLKRRLFGVSEQRIRTAWSSTATQAEKPAQSSRV